MQTKDILKYRNIWMAIAMLWIMLFHTTFNCSDVIRLIRQIGYGGTDIFLFSSGLGIYASLKNDSNLGDYIWRRGSRLMPLYWVFLVPWGIVKKYTVGISIRDIIANIFCIQYISGGNGPCVNWYWTILWILYLLAPFLFELIQRCERRIQYISILMISIVAVVPFWNDGYLNMGFSRIPIFIEGMMFGKVLLTKSYIKRKTIIEFFVISILGIVMTEKLIVGYYWQAWQTGMLWYPMLMIVPGICLGISYVMCGLEKHGITKVYKVLEVIGNNTLEIFLAHVLLVELFRDYILIKHVQLNTVFYWSLLYLINILASLGLYYTQHLLGKGCRVYRKRSKEGV